jgi:hypothetical protein
LAYWLIRLPAGAAGCAIACDRGRTATAGFEWPPWLIVAQVGTSNGSCLYLLLAVEQQGHEPGDIFRIQASLYAVEHQYRVAATSSHGSHHT